LQASTLPGEAPKSTQSINYEDAETQFKLGQAFRLGEGVPQNSEEAFVMVSFGSGARLSGCRAHARGNANPRADLNCWDIGVQLQSTQRLLATLALAIAMPVFANC
jgi:TPR repeat protein